VRLEHRDRGRGVGLRLLAASEVPTGSVETHVGRSDPQRITERFPQPQCLLGGDQSLVRIVDHHALGGELVVQRGAVAVRALRSEPQCGAVVVDGFPV
jgi:hypothetical protein